MQFITWCGDSGVGHERLTLKDGADLPPGSDAPLTGVLAQRRLQEEDRNAAGKEEDEVGDEEGTCGWETGCVFLGSSLLVVQVQLFPLPLLFPVRTQSGGLGGAVQNWEHWSRCLEPSRGQESPSYLGPGQSLS